MPKYTAQKLKILYILDILKKYTDENHGITMKRIIAELERYDINAERKSVYNDIALLRDVYGADIVMNRAGGDSEYSLLSRDFELAELKLLVDAVQSSRFITHKKSLGLIRKLESLTSKKGASALQGQVYVANRIKTMNETIYYNVDAINSAISLDRQITFKYFEWTPERTKKFRRGGSLYRVSPNALCWDNENYYLVAFDHITESVRHYRVDKMMNIIVTDKKRDMGDAFRNFDAAVYSKSIFGMYHGELQRVTLRFENSLAGAVIDRFGADAMLIPDGDTFTVTVPVSVSPQFFAWLCGFGDLVKIESPSHVINEFKEHINKITKNYG